MNMNQIIEFILTSEYHSFSKAARKLNMFQQNLVSHMRNLENELNTPLFITSKKGTTLTPKGEELLPYFMKIYESYEKLIEINQLGTIIRIGEDSNIHGPITIKAVTKYQENHQNVPVQIISTNRYKDLPVLLSEGIIDAYFGYYRDDLKTINFKKLFLDSLCIAVSAKKQITKPYLSLEDLEGKQILYDNINLYKNKILFDELNKRKIHYTGKEYSTETEADIEVTNDKSILIIHSSYIPSLSPDEQALPVEDITVPYGIFYRKKDPNIIPFIEYVSQSFSK